MADTDRRKWLALALLCVVQFMVVLDIAIVNVALPSIQVDLGFSQENLQWVVSAYALVFGGFLLLGGRAADLLGRAVGAPGRSLEKMHLAGLAIVNAAEIRAAAERPIDGHRVDAEHVLEFVEQVERRSTLKRYAGHPLFVYAALATWFRHYDRSRPRFALRSEGVGGNPECVVDDAYFAIPGAQLRAVEESLAVIVHANHELEKFHRARAAGTATA